MIIPKNRTAQRQPRVRIRVAGLPGPGWVAVLLGVSIALVSVNSLAHKCLYVSSYHQGYEWNDGIERGIEDVIGQKCDLDKFYLDTKRHKETEFAKKMALAAKQHIDTTRPDVVIACDDNASKYLIQPYYKDADLPVVFCGINWTVDEYGYPYSNVTGMVEVIPIGPLLDVVQAVVGTPTDGVYLSSDVYTEHKDFERYRKIFAEKNMALRGVFVRTLADWKTEYERAQDSGFIVLGNNAGINDWDKAEASQHAHTHVRVFTVTNYDWMTPYAMFAMTKLPEEQGEWAAKVALSILDGEQPADIPIIVNRRWNILVNTALMSRVAVQLPAHIQQKAVKVDP